MNQKQENFLSQLSTEQFEKFKAIAKKKCVPADTIVIRENDLSQSFYYIAEGEVELSKTPGGSINSPYFNLPLYESIHLKTMAAGRFIGESHFFNDNPQSYNVTSTKDTVLYELSYEKMNQLKSTHLELYNSIMPSLCNHLSVRLENTNQLLTDEIMNRKVKLKKKNYFLRLLLNILVFFCFILLLSGIIQNFYSHASLIQKSIMSSSIICLCYFAVHFVGGKPDKKFFGLTLNGWKSSVKNSVWLTIVMGLIMMILKYLAILYLPSFSQKPFFSGWFFRNQSLTAVMLSASFYVVLVFVQELIARGIIQGALNEIFEGPYKVWFAILVSNLIFASLHIINFPLLITVSVFFVGLPWGWLYSKDRTLLGVFLSHAIIGVFGVWVLGVGV